MGDWGWRRAARSIHRDLRRVGAGLLLWVGASDCGRFGFEVLDAEYGPGDPIDGLVTLSRGGAGSALADSGLGAEVPVDVALPGWGGGATLDAAPPSGGGSMPLLDGGGATGGSMSGSGGAGGGSSLGDEACVLQGNEAIVHGFDSGTDGAVAVGTGSSVTWNSTDGNPNPGAVEYDNPGGAPGQVLYSGSLGNLTGRFVSLNVRVLSGSNVRLRLFTLSGSQQLRGEGAFVTPTGSAWDCSTLDISNPASAELGHDPTNIVGMGVDVEGSGSISVQIDQIAY